MKKTYYDFIDLGYSKDEASYLEETQEMISKEDLKTLSIR